MPKFSVICDDPVSMPWVVNVEGESPDALAEAVKQAASPGLVRPVLVIDYERLKAWRVGIDDDGWYLSDSSEVKMGAMTEPKHIARDASAMEASCES